MLRNQEPDRNIRDRNIEDLTDEEINSAIHYLDLEAHFESNRKQRDGDGLPIAIISVILLFGVMGFILLYR